MSILSFIGVAALFTMLGIGCGYNIKDMYWHRRWRRDTQGLADWNKAKRKRAGNMVARYIREVERLQAIQDTLRAAWEMSGHVNQMHQKLNGQLRVALTEANDTIEWTKLQTGTESMFALVVAYRRLKRENKELQEKALVEAFQKTTVSYVVHGDTVVKE